MRRRSFKQWTARDRVLIAKLRWKKLTITEIARQLGKNKSTISRELRRDAERITPQDRYFYFGVGQLWSEEQLDEYIATLPTEEQRTHEVWTHEAGKGLRRPASLARQSEALPEES